VNASLFLFEEKSAKNYENVDSHDGSLTTDVRLHKASFCSSWFVVFVVVVALFLFNGVVFII
jgi:hypothetical protein